jgi:hypothetical protein
MDEFANHRMQLVLDIRTYLFALLGDSVTATHLRKEGSDWRAVSCLAAATVDCIGVKAGKESPAGSRGLARPIETAAPCACKSGSPECQDPMDM